MKKQKEKRNRRPHWFVTILLLIVVLVLAGSSWQTRQRQQIVYPESLDQVAASVNGTSLTLRDIAFYVAYEEAEVEKQAFAYDAEHPKKYWGIRLNGSYVYAAARNAIIQMAIHDELFYRMAVKEKIALTDEEKQALSGKEQEFWQDLVEDGKDELLGVSEKDIAETMKRIAYAQKYQSIYAQMQGTSYEDYDFTSETYQTLLEKQDYSINKRAVKRLGVGSITLDYEDSEKENK